MEKIKWGVLGTAKIGATQIIPALMRSKNSEFYAIASRDISKLTAFEGKCKKLYGSYEELLSDEEIKAVYIPLPNHLHCEWTVKALNAGKHVLCEKPLAMNYEECVKMAEAAKRNNRYLMEGFMYRHTNKSKMIADIIKSGRLGPIQYIRSEHGFEINDPKNVRLRKETGGGALFDMGCYPVNFCNWIAKLTGTKLESSHGFFVTRQDMDGDYVDARSNAQLNYENGMTAVAASWIDAVPHAYSEIFGRYGKLLIPFSFTDDPIPMQLTWYDYESDPMCKEQEIMFMPHEYFRHEQFLPEPSDRYCMEVSELSNAILEGREPSFTMEESLTNMKVIDELYATMTPNEKSPAIMRY
ncbi:MAG TPA: Gfo/Idh/MocA family oxidoreductase [Clostridia bacterium]|nr:Gfo/Idh/MocA family oxidoreductase [Clostridia bacterium]